MYVLWQTKKRCMSCGRPEMHTGRTRNVMHVLWQTRNAYKTYQKCDAGPVASQKCVQDIYIYIYKMRCVSCGRPEMRTGHTRNVMYVLWQTRIAYRTYQKCIQDIYIYQKCDVCPVADQKCVQDIPEMWCMSCGRPESQSVLGCYRISLVGKRRKREICFNTRFWFQSLAYQLAAACADCCNETGLCFLTTQLSFIPAPSLLTPLPPVPPPSFPCPLPLTLLTPLPPLPPPSTAPPSLPLSLPCLPPSLPLSLPCPPPLHSSLHSILLLMPPCFRMQPPLPSGPPPHCWSFSLQFKLTLPSFPLSKLHLNLNYAVLVLRCVCVCRSKHEKVQMKAYFFWHGHTVCNFLGKSPFSSHRTTLKQQINS